jgi:hypothetical protein
MTLGMCSLADGSASAAELNASAPHLRHPADIADYCLCSEQAHALHFVAA